MNRAMDAASADAPLDSFAAKWGAARPEFALALKFVAQPVRRTRTAFACLAYELEHAAFGLRDAQPAAAKLQWWANEFTCARRGEASHPLTRALAAHARFQTVSLAHWFDAVHGALAQRDREPPADAEALLAAHAELYAPLAAIEALLFPPIDTTAAARARGLSRALRETAGLAAALSAGHLPVPLDVLARHRLARGDLAQTSTRTADALREWLAWLAGECLRTGDSAALGVLAKAGLAANAWRARAAVRAADPAAELDALFQRLPLRAVWAAWHAGRRAQALARA